MNIFELALDQENNKKLVSGHRTCSGCGIPQIVRTVLSAAGKNVIAAAATGCLEVTTTIYPYSSWNIPFIHSAFENAAATISGVEKAYNVLKKKGKIKDDIKFVAFGGDGGTSDIGLQSLSGALERMHNMVYVQYDNEAYMNTGIQRSSATPYGASTTTTPVGKIHPGKELFRKDLTRVVTAHKIPYVAQASVGNLIDLYNKAKKAFEVNGPAFLNVLQPCTLGWKFPSDLTIRIADLAVKTNFWPLYEVENGSYKINLNEKRVSIEKYLKLQKRFKHLFDSKNKWIIKKIQKHIDSEYELLKSLDNKKVF